MLVLLAALFPTSYFYNAALPLRPLCVARGLGWCDHDYPRWGGHALYSLATYYVLGAPASIMGSELLQAPLWGSDSSLCPVPMP